MDHDAVHIRFKLRTQADDLLHLLLILLAHTLDSSRLGGTLLFFKVRPSRSIFVHVAHDEASIDALGRRLEP